MDLVVGAGPLAEALAASLGREHPALLVGPAPGAPGPCMWRWGDLDSGEGVAAAARGARRVFFVIDRVRTSHGAFAVIEKLGIGDGVAAAPIGVPFPAALDRQPGWSRVEVGPCWGPSEPLVARWSALVASGQHVWLADPGPIPAVSMPDAVAAVRAAVTLEAARWRITTATMSRLPQLADALAVWHDRPLRATRVPLALAARQIGLDAGAVRDWARAPVADAETPGWEMPATAGRQGWVAGLRRSRAA